MESRLVDSVVEGRRIIRLRGKVAEVAPNVFVFHFESYEALFLISDSVPLEARRGEQKVGCMRRSVRALASSFRNSCDVSDPASISFVSLTHLFLLVLFLLLTESSEEPNQVDPLNQRKFIHQGGKSFNRSSSNFFSFSRSKVERILVDIV